MRALALIGAWTLVGFLPVTGEAQVISGRLLDNETRRPVVNGTVILLDSLGAPVARVLSDSQGRFRVEAPGPGRYTIRGWGLGYRGGIQSRFHLEAGQEVAADIYLLPEPLEMDPFVVSAERVRSELERQGFYRRREEGRGFFLTPNQLKARPPVTEAELIGRAPFVRLHRTWTGSNVQMRRFGEVCEPAIFVDNFQAAPRPMEEYVFLEDHVNFADIVAIEVYRGLAEIPQELAVGPEDCGVIMVWTVYSELRNRKGGR